MAVPVETTTMWSALILHLVALPSELTLMQKASFLQISLIKKNYKLKYFLFLAKKRFDKNVLCLH